MVISSGQSCALVASVALIFCTQARAESAKAITPSEDGVGELVVTARRQAEEAGAVPLAVSVVSGAQIDRLRVAELQDLQRYVPSLQTSQINRDDVFVTLRGQGPGVGAFPGVLTYFNEVPFRGLGQGFEYDLASVQVLKGPQGTLFGRNSNGGAILFGSAAPKTEFGGYIQGGLGDYRNREAQGALNIPFAGETLLLRVAGSLVEREGFTRLLGSNKRLDDRGSRGARVSLRWTPSAAVRNDVVADLTRIRTSGSSAILIGLNPNGPLAQVPPATGVAQAAFGLLAQQAALGPRTQVGASADPVRKVDGWGVMDRLEVELGDLTFTNILAYRRYRRLTRADYDGTPLPLVDYSTTPSGWETDDAQTTEEAQVRGSRGPLTYTAGFYYQDNRPVGSPRQLGVLYFQPIQLVSEARDLSRALYGDLRYDAGRLLSGLSLSAGYRRTWDRRRQRAATVNFATGLCSGAGATPPACLLEDTARFEAGNWTLTAGWQASGSTLLYATARRGYKSGGLNLGQPFVNRRSYSPEFLTDQEVGVKSGFRLGDLAGRFSVDAYHGKYRDIQVNALVIDQTAIYNLVENGAKATIKGVEADLSLTFAGKLDLDFAYAYTDAAYDRYISSIYGDLTASAWPYTSKHKGSVGLAYRPFRSATIGRPELSVRYSFQSAATFGYEPDPATREPGYGLVDARIDFRQIAGRPIDFGVFVTNLTDKLYRTGVIGTFFTAGVDSAVYGEPRMVGAQLRFRFGGEAQ